MKIQHIIVGLNIGGAEVALQRLIKSHERTSKYEHEVVSLTTIGPIGDELERAGIKISCLDMRSVFDIPKVISKLARLVRASRPDVVQTWMYHADLLGGVAARLAGNDRVIWGIRTTDVRAAATKSTVIVQYLCAFLSRWIPRRIICVAEAARASHRQVGYDAAKMLVIPNGFELSRFDVPAAQALQLRETLGFSARDIVIGTVGRFDPAKDFPNFVDAAAELFAKHDNVKVVMVGRGLHKANVELMQCIKNTGYPDKFLLLDERKDIARCLSAIDIFCLPSRTEGFPNVVGEAMAAARPCVVTDVGDAALLVGDTGIVVAKEDSVALADGLGMLVAMSHQERRVLGEQARKRIDAEFTVDRARERFEAVYESILENEKGRQR